MSLRRLLAALGLGLALLVAGPAPAVDALEATVSAEAPSTAARATVRRRRAAVLALLRARPVRPRRRPGPVHVARLRPAAGHEAPRRAPPTLLI